MRRIVLYIGLIARPDGRIDWLFTDLVLHGTQAFSSGLIELRYEVKHRHA